MKEFNKQRRLEGCWYIVSVPLKLAIIIISLLVSMSISAGVYSEPA